uniref:Uncharacterized protein n=1 Tax=Oryctolagus cuniculus TaxID=9986 RepID=A0A5F9DLR0_RABIT
MACTLAYSKKLEELRESFLDNKSLATRIDQDSRTALHRACSDGHTEIIEFSSFHHFNQNGCTPLYNTAFKSRQETAIMLLQGGANPDTMDHYEAISSTRAAAGAPC